MAHYNTTPQASSLEEAVIALFCLTDDAYRLLNPTTPDAYGSLKRLSDSEVLTLALLQQLRGTESERSFLRDMARFFSHLFPGVVGLHPSSLHRRVRRLLGDLAYRSGALGEELARSGVLLLTERADRRASIRQQVEVCFAALKGVFGMDGTLAKTLVGLVTRIAAKVTAYTYGMYVNRLLGRPQGRIKELWA